MGWIVDLGNLVLCIGEAVSTWPHLHKMGYPPDEHTAFLRLWEAAGPESSVGSCEADLRPCLNHERIKSVIVDSVRYAKVLADGNRSSDQAGAVVTNLV
ncbi:hypothetical protein ACQP1O_31815 [Nocardia sp. CA-151230]|uniref:hypothetical protein n=1 Tax=Nocardia sp. CA-151230 TaxID=3239982 RepID=UPI003D8AD2F9